MIKPSPTDKIKLIFNADSIRTYGLMEAMVLHPEGTIGPVVYTNKLEGDEKAPPADAKAKIVWEGPRSDFEFVGKPIPSKAASIIRRLKDHVESPGMTLTR